MEGAPTSTAVLDPALDQQALDQETARLEQAARDKAITDQMAAEEAARVAQTQPPITGEQNPPPTPFVEDWKKGMQIKVVDESSGVEASKRDYAANRLNEETSQAGFRGLLKKIWKGNLARDYYTLKYQKEGADKIDTVTEGKLYVLHGGTAQDETLASKAIVERFAFGGDSLHTGEKENSLSSIGKDADPTKFPNGVGSEIEVKLRQMVGLFAEGRIDEATLTSWKSKAVKILSTTINAEDRKKGQLLADNIVEVAKNAKAAFDNHIGLDKIDEALTFKHGEALMGVRTEAKLNTAERVLDRLHKSKFGSIVNENTLILAVGATVAAGSFLSKKVSTAVLRTASAGVASGFIAGVRENIHIKQDRSTHSRNMAEGGGESLIHSGKRREKLEATRYETKAANDLIANIARRLETADNGDVGLRDLVKSVVEAKARIQKSDQDNIDLIHFSSKEKVETERFGLDMKIAEARAKIQGMLHNADDATLRRTGAVMVAKDGKDVVTRDVNSLLTNLADRAVTTLENGEITAKDRAFQKLRRSEVAKKAALGFVTGEVIALGVQEVKAAFSSDLQGVFDAQGDGSEKRTLLAGILHGDNDPGIAATHELLPATPGHEPGVIINGHSSLVSHVEVPTDYKLHEVAGKWELSDPKGHAIDRNVTFDKNGQLSHATHDELSKQGFKFGVKDTLIHDKNTSETIKDAVTYKNVDKSPSEYISDHKGQFQAVTREKWFDNGTPNTPDHNETDLWWGGENNTGVDAQGNYVFDVAHMTPDGSWTQGASVNAQQLIQEGKMSIALSMTEGTQTHVMMVQINEHGQAVIDKDNPAYKAMFEKGADGKAHFMGAYAEAVEVGPKGPDGVQHINPLATVVGENKVQHITDRVAEAHHHTKTLHHEHHVVTTVMEAPKVEHDIPAVLAKVDLPVEIPGVIPIYARAGLEQPTAKSSGEQESPLANEITSQPASDESPSNTDKSPDTTPENPYSSYGRSPESGEDYDHAEWFSKTLVENPRAKLDQKAELADYKRRLTERSGDEYVRSLEDSIAKDPVLSSLGDRGNIRAIVAIPVSATGESDNIYGTLSLYAQQEDQKQRSTPVLLHVNWPEDAMKDNEKREKIAKTFAEIERARQEFPYLQVASFNTEWPQDYFDDCMNNHGGIIQPVVERLFDVALLAVNKGVEEGRISEDVTIIRNDSDSVGMSRDYIGNVIRASDKNSLADAFSGPSRWETRLHGDYPGFAIASNTREVMQSILGLRKFNRQITTIGMNTSVRASSLAAVGSIHRREGDRWGGAGTDDMELGARIYAARLGKRSVPSYSNNDSSETLARIAGRTNYSYGYGHASGTDVPDDIARPIEYVTGAQIDTLGDRLLKQYRQGKPFSTAWDRFSQETRGQVGADTALSGPEDMDDPDAIIGSIEFQLNDQFNSWFRNPAQVRLGLALQFGTEDTNGNKLYDVSYADERCIFSFTAAGKAWLSQTLKFDGYGRPDKIGDRVARQQYNEIRRGAPRLPASRQPRFVKALS